MRSLSPLAIRVGWVSFDRSDGRGAAELLDCLQLRLERLDADRLVAVDRALLRGV